MFTVDVDHSNKQIHVTTDPIYEVLVSKRSGLRKSDLSIVPARLSDLKNSNTTPRWQIVLLQIIIFAVLILFVGLLTYEALDYFQPEFMSRVLLMSTSADKT